MTDTDIDHSILQEEERKERKKRLQSLSISPSGPSESAIMPRGSAVSPAFSATHSSSSPSLSATSNSPTAFNFQAFSRGTSTSVPRDADIGTILPLRKASPKVMHGPREEGRRLTQEGEGEGGSEGQMHCSSTAAGKLLCQLLFSPSFQLRSERRRRRRKPPRFPTRSTGQFNPEREREREN